MNVRSNLGAALVSLMLAFAASAETVAISSQGASDAENAEMSELYTRLSGRPDSPNIRLREISDLIEVHPNNRFARLARADLLMNCGRVGDASADLDYLDQHDKTFIGLAAAKAELAFVSGSKEKAIIALQELAKPNANVDPADKAAWQIKAELAKLRLSEMSGNRGATDEAWAKFLTENSNKQIYMTEYGDYHARQGDFDAAAKDYLENLGSMAKNQPSVDATADGELHLAAALWASGKPEEAEKQAAEAMNLLLDRKDITGRPSYFLQRSVCMTFALTQQGIGPDSDRVNAAAELKAFAELLGKWDYIDNDSLVAVQAGVISKETAEQQLESILKDAPRLEWALWSEMYIGIKFPEDAQRVLKLMPEPSVQRAILTRLSARSGK